ncbi:hypothetical protein CVT26_013567 [Gymnopilus dilepis]|uniref:DUF2415 domain-containing protein n=1 Tax=Gymnopilus dilepis TaxID=231916 RepID=A0A409WSV1_9AGAR|nr:hypothetical protein CVT26_013567 [Gymnopilus dilepis]
MYGPMNQAISLRAISETPHFTDEHVALAPQRLLSLLQRPDGSTVRPMSVRALAPRLTMAEKKRYLIDDNDGLYDTLVDSSGRYLATLSAYEAFTLFSVWDLGLSGHSSIKPVARYLEPARLKLYLDGFWHGPPGSDTLYLISTHESSLLTPLSVLVHRVCMACPPKISLFAMLEIPVAVPYIFARIYQIPHTSRLVLQYDDDDENKHFWVWDFINHTVAALTATDYKPAGKEMFLHYDDCIMAANEGCIRIYNIPPLVPRSAMKDPLQCKANIIIAAPSDSPNSFFVGNNMAQIPPFYFSEVTSTRLTLFEVKSNAQCADPQLPNKLPLTAGAVDVGDLAFLTRDQRFMSLNRCEDRLLLGSFSSSGSDSGDFLVFSAGVGEDFAGTEGATLRKTIFSNPLCRLDIKRRQFYPQLGRLCLHTRQRASYSRSIRNIYVLDYLASPELY